MHIDSLRHFLELAEAGSFYRAADRAFLTQQGLNREITGLESELGMQLIVRRGRRGVRLTTRGEVFRAHAQTLVEAYDAMLDDLLRAEPAAEGREQGIVLFTTFYTSQMVMGNPALHHLASHLTLYEVPFETMVAKAKTSEGDELFLADVYPRTIERLKGDGQLTFESLFQTQLGLLWNAEKPQTFRRVVHREEVTALPLALSSEREVSDWVDWVFRDHPLSNVKLRSGTAQHLMEFVANGYFSTFDSQGFALRKAKAGNVIANLQFSPFATADAIARIGLLRRRDKPLSARARTYADLLRRLLSTTKTPC